MPKALIRKFLLGYFIEGKSEGVCLMRLDILKLFFVTAKLSFNVPGN
jgi:hypothetical protein